MHARRAAAAMAAAAVASLALAGGSPRPAGAAAPITFETPAVVDPLLTGGEPDINVDPQGRVFASAPTGTGTQRSVWYGSVDGGHTYRDISANLPPSTVTGFTQPPGGGDTDIQFDHTGKQYFTDLYALACFRTATSTDGGATVGSSPTGGCAKTNGSAADRQWLAVYDPPPLTPKLSAYTGPTPLVYMEYNAYPVGSEWERSSSANDTAAGGPGLNFTDAIKGHPPTAVYSPFGHDGYPSIDQSTGDVLEANYGGGGSGTSDIQLNIGVPDAAGDLTFRDAAGQPGLVTVAKGVIDDRGDAANFVVSSIDQGRNLWVAWVARATDSAKAQAFVAVASASSGWTAWSKPVQVSAPPSMVSVFPWVKAGAAGRADVVWYGSNRLGNPSTDNGQSWDVFMAQVVWPTDGLGQVLRHGTPAVEQVKVSPHPMKYGDICLTGTFCITGHGNRNLADFFNISIDRSGAAEIVYNDTSNGLIEPGFVPVGGLADHAGAPVITVARQASGPGLYGTEVAGPSNAPVAGLTDPSGDALNPVIGGTNVPGLDIVGSSLSLSGGTLSVRTSIVDLSNPSATASAVHALLLQYVTRWQMGNTIYFAGAEQAVGGPPIFYAGSGQSLDLCSVSGCDPHVVLYPEVGTASHTEGGTVTCPTTPSASSPCTITISVSAADVGSPSSSSLLEEVGTYALASLTPQSAMTNVQGQIGNLPLEVDGVCCWNFRASAVVPTTPTPASTPSGGPTAAPTPTPTPGLVNTTAASPSMLPAVLAAALVGGLAGGARGRRRRRRR